MENNSGSKYAWLMVIYTNILFILFMVTAGFDDFEIDRITRLTTYLPIIGVLVGTVFPMYVAQSNLSRKSLIVKIFPLIVGIPTSYFIYHLKYRCSNTYCSLGDGVAIGTGVFLIVSFLIFYGLGLYFQRCSEKMARNLSIIIPITILGILMMF